MNTAPRAASNADPNSAAAFGERMRYRLNDMIAHPYSFLPSYKSRYETLLKYAASLTPQQSSKGEHRQVLSLGVHLF